MPPPSRSLRILISLAACFFLLSSARAQIRDGGIDPKNLGKGEWIYIVPDARAHMNGNVPAVNDDATMMIFLKNQGVRYIVVKASTGTSLYAPYGTVQFTSNLVSAAHAAGLWIFGYIYTTGADIPGEVGVANYIFTNGADGLVLDGEAEWKVLPDKGTNALWLCSTIRSNWPNKFFAHSPYAYLYSHSSFPYREFGYYVDAVMPQDYFIEFGDTPTDSVNIMNTHWRTWQSTNNYSTVINGKTYFWTNSIKPLAPIGQAWTSASGTITPELITEFVNALKNVANPATAGGYKGVSYWRAELQPADVWEAVRTNNITVWSNAPVLTNVSIASVADVSATIAWTTDQSSDSVVEFGLTTSYGNSVTNSSSVYYHTAVISGLTPNTTYHYRVKSKNAANQQAISADYVVTTLAAVVNDLIIESRKPDGTLTANPPYTDFNFADSTLKSSAGGLSGTGSRYALGGTPNYTIKPTLGVAGGSFDVYLTHGSASSISDDMIVAVTQTGCTGLPATTTLYRETGGNTWEYLGRMTCSPATNKPVLTFTYSSGTLNSTNRMYSDSIKFVYVPPPPSGPSITTQPQNQTVVQGDTASFNVIVAGTAPLSYQWRFNGSNIAGATLSTYSRNAAQPADAGFYSVIVTNSVSSILSSNASLVVNVPPNISAQPQTVSTNAGADVTFSVTATGTAPLNYQWRFNTTNILGATGTSYTRTNVQAADAGAYSVIVSNVAASVTSDDAMLTIADSPPPPINLSISLTNGSARIQIEGALALYALDGSSNLVDWTELTNFPTPASSVEYVDPDVTQAQRYYRARLVP